MNLINLYDYECAAREKLPKEVYDYFAGGANDEITVLENHTAYDQIKLQYRVLRGIGERDLSTTILGQAVSMPVLIAPTAFHCLAHPEGEKATARAAAKANTIMILSMASTMAIEDVSTAANEIQSATKIWFQLYIQPDLDFTIDLIRRAETVGCSALVLTVDSPIFRQK